MPAIDTAIEGDHVLCRPLLRSASRAETPRHSAHELRTLT